MLHYNVYTVTSNHKMCSDFIVKATLFKKMKRNHNKSNWIYEIIIIFQESQFFSLNTTKQRQNCRNKQEATHTHKHTQIHTYKHTLPLRETQIVSESHM